MFCVGELVRVKTNEELKGNENDIEVQLSRMFGGKLATIRVVQNDRFCKLRWCKSSKDEMKKWLVDNDFSFDIDILKREW